MDDGKIIELFFDRDETAIRETSDKFGGLCRAIALNILHNPEDAEQCVNDALLKAWESIPPNDPKNLKAYLARIVKNISINRYRLSQTEKRGGAVDEVFDELEELCVSETSVEQQAERKEILAAVNAFLARLPSKKRMLFVRRYWYCDSTEQLAQRFSMTESNIFTTLSRIRADLKNYLRKRGFLDE